MRFIYLILLFPFSSLANVMNLNNFMPTRLEDATPIDKKNFDVQMSSAFEKKSQDSLTIRPNVRYGLTHDVQLETQGTLVSGGGESGHGETDVSLLYRFVKGEKLPSISLTPLFSFPTGKEQSRLDAVLQLNITQTLRGVSDRPLTEIHLNLGTRSKNDRDEDERGSLEGMAIGISHKLGEDVALIADYVHDEKEGNHDAVQVIEAGIHTHLGSDYYLGLSFTQGLGHSETLSGGILGLEKQFGVSK